MSARSPYLEQLEQLATPVPDLAATLTTQAEQDANDDNVSFLRTPLPNPSTQEVSSYSTPTEEEIIRLDRENQRRAVARAVAVERRYTLTQLQELGDLHEPSYADRISRQRHGYLGWAPGSSEDEGDAFHSLPNTSNRSRSSAELYYDRYARRQPRIAERETGGNPRTSSWGQSHFIENGVGAAPTVTESSLRTTALLQSVRRNSRFSARSRTELQNYILGRERPGQENGNREQVSPARSHRAPNATAPHSLSNGLSQDIQQRLERERTSLEHEERERLRIAGITNGANHAHQAEQQHQQNQRQRDNRAPIDAYRQRYLDNPSARSPGPSKALDEVIKYLERLRFCKNYRESLSSAAAGGFVREEFFSLNPEDFILDTKHIGPPPETSWLKVGGSFSGFQHAAGGSSLPAYHLYDRSAYVPTNSTASSRNGMHHFRHESTMANATSRGPESDERWPVKVTIQSIDYDNMTLSGTMEAFNVPDKSSPTQESSITTFLEGEMIDFNTYTLETKSFKADARVDGTYWRKLEPFKKLTDDEMHALSAPVIDAGEETVSGIRAPIVRRERVANASATYLQDFWYTLRACRAVILASRPKTGIGILLGLEAYFDSVSTASMKGPTLATVECPSVELPRYNSSSFTHVN
ncbi:hypothetical protein MMC12_004800 [Toensbergia leucococca]|nr:hypothetical protein [Toensbergia leucococca]